MPFGRSLGIRCKLILIFVFIKVLPLVALAWVAWSGITLLGVNLQEKIARLSSETQDVISQVSDLAVDNSIRALDLKSRESIERLTTDTARSVATFLYGRDDDIRQAASLEPTEENYRKFLAPMLRNITGHKPWVLNEAGDAWIPVESKLALKPTVAAKNKDNAKDFHYRPPEFVGIPIEKPLYLEMTFVDLQGNEKIKITPSGLLPKAKRNVADPANTYCKAEHYFSSLKALKPGEVSVSEVIGAYVKSPIIGPFTRKRAEEKGVPFNPEEAAYAGKENPVGKRFQGLVRWATPVEKNGTIIGWVTLALDHTHLMEFTDHIVPTEERYSAISDAGSGNYAFMWDYKDRNISHPRDYFIVAYDPETGQPAVPWLEQTLYEDYIDSGLTIMEWEEAAPLFQEQSLKKKPSTQLIKEGLLGLDCRYLNFAPQCEGWYNLTRNGGSGSFVIFWSGLWKLTTAAAIPYHTGRYSGPRGFGFVTIGANVHEFHKAATETGDKIVDMAADFEKNLAMYSEETQLDLKEALTNTTREIAFSTLIMVVIVIFIAIWMAATLTRKITNMIKGIRLFQGGNMEHRLAVESKDEVGQLAQTFNEMSDDIQNLILHLREAEEKYRGFFENATEGIFRSRKDGKLISVNPAFARLFGYDSPEEIISNVHDVGEELYVDSGRRQELLKQLEAHGSVRDFEYDVTLKDGTTRHLSTSCYYVTGKDGERYLEGMTTDISERKLKEAAEIEKEAAVASSKAKSIFLANMSHEIRTPMNALLGMADLLSETRLDEKQKHFVSMFQSAGESLLTLLNEILDFSKIEAEETSIDKAPFTIAEIFSIVQSIMTIQAESRDLTLTSHVAKEVPPMVLGDKLRIKQVLLNLVGNAVKFTKQGSISMKAEVAEAHGSTAVIRFSVADSGIGIDEEKTAEVFEAFNQADSSTTKEYGGTGLGLTIAKDLVELMGGSITVKSTPQVGTTFHFDIPFEILTEGQPAQDIAEEVASTQPETVREKTVLLVEDSDSNRILIELYLKDSSHSLIMCENGAEGVAEFKRNPDIDVILMDILMPVLDGLEATKQIRAYEAEQDLGAVPIIALTANAFAEDRERCLEAGCSHYVSKPVKKTDLLTLINSVERT
ncbi:ATP-binding protein [Pseudodesulfovibrio sp.]|nr:ATP-binding protein [Pseudodesulfovibrio sp.]